MPDIYNEYFHRSQNNHSFSYPFQQGDITYLSLPSNRSDYYLAIQTNEPEVHFFVIDRETKTNVGQLRSELFKSGFLYIDDVSISPEHRNKGLGLDLYKAAINNSKGLVSDATLTKTNKDKDGKDIKGQGSYYIWKKLLLDPNITVSYFDCLDLSNDKNYCLYILKPVDDIDEHIGNDYSNNNSKGNIRFVAQIAAQFS